MRASWLSATSSQCRSGQKSAAGSRRCERNSVRISRRAVCVSCAGASSPAASSSRPSAPSFAAAGSERRKGRVKAFAEIANGIRAIARTLRRNELVREVAKRPGQLAVGGAGEADRAPLRATHLHVRQVVVEGDRPQEILLLAEGPQVQAIPGDVNVRPDLVEEEKKGCVAGAEALGPAPQADEVLLRRPVLPRVARPRGCTAREAPALDVTSRREPQA